MHLCPSGRATLLCTLTALVAVSCSYSDYNPYCGNGRLEPDNGEVCDNAIPAGESGACPEDDCNDGDACTDDAVASGSRDTCSLICVHTSRGLADGDGCCPEGATRDDDSDCTGSLCGNGVVDNGEMCDTGIASGTGACPISCNDGLPCTTDALAGVGCLAHCDHTDVTTTSGQTADGCCPQGATSGTDIDCPASCGNGAVDLGETCDSAITTGDGACPTAADCDDHNGCTSDSVNGGGCTQRCQNELITAPSGQTIDRCCPGGANNNTDTDCPIACGNGAVESGEQCDVAIAQVLSGHCPNAAECNDNRACTDDSLAGEGTCGARCEHAQRGVSGEITDGCCPAIGSFNTDADCPAVCGNGVLEAGAGEACDTTIAAGQAGHCPASAAECDDTNACTTDGTSGTGCARACTHPAVTQCQLVDDGCCPAGCNANIDGDCSPSCGNGTVEGPPAGNETCDTEIAAGSSGACPTLASCNDNMACTADSVAGSGCNQVCVNAPINDASGDVSDGCCPPGANSTTDTDCPVVCGNDLVETGETCDTGIAVGQPGACPRLADCTDSDACTTDGLDNPGTCRAACAPHTGIVPCCGNGEVESGETCDTSIPSGQAGACPTTCNDNNPCTTDTSSGSACTASCTHTPFQPCCGDGIVTNTGELEETCDTAIAAGQPGSCERITCNDGIDCTSDAPVSAGGNACKKICPHSPINDPDGAGMPDGCCPPQSRFLQDADCNCGDGTVDATSFEQCDDANASNGDNCTNSCTLGGGMAVGSPCTMDSDCSALGSGAACVLTTTLPPLTNGVVNGYCSRLNCDPRAEDSNANGIPQNIESCPQLVSTAAPDAICVQPPGGPVGLCLSLCNLTHAQNDCRRTENGPVPGGWAYRCLPLAPTTTGVCFPRDPRSPSLPTFP